MLSPTLQQRKQVLQALRQRCAMATEEFYAKAGITAPPVAIRYRVEARHGAWAVVDCVTQRLHGQCKSHAEALRYAKQLEAALIKRAVRLGSAKWLGDAMTRYLSLLGLVLLVLVYAWG